MHNSALAKRYCQFIERGGRYYCPVCDPDFQHPEEAPIIRECKAPGVGTELEKFFSRLGIRKRDGCRCKELRDMLDTLEPRQVMEAADSVAREMAREAEKRLWGHLVPYKENLLRSLIRRKADMLFRRQLASELQAMADVAGESYNSRPLLVIASVHCSYSSLLANMLERLGIFFGWPTQGGEDIYLAAFLEDIQRFPSSIPDYELFNELFPLWIKQHLARAGARQAAVKYPTLGFYLWSLERMVPIKLLVLNRPLDESIASLIDRSVNRSPKATPEEAIKLQQKLSEDIWTFADRHKGKLIVDSHKLLKAPIETLGEITQWLGLMVPIERLEAAASAIDPARIKHTNIDAAGAIAPPRRFTLADITCCITTIGYRNTMPLTVASIRQYIPEARVLIADYSKEGIPDIEGAIITRLPFDYGLSAARNYLAELAETKLLLYLDDDCPIADRHGVEAALEILDIEDLDAICGCRVARTGVAQHFCRPIKFAKIRELNHISPWPWLVKRCTAGYQWDATSTMLNVLLIKRESALNCRWDDGIKIGREHIDWILNAWRHGLRIGYYPQFAAFHIHDATPEYVELRSRREFDNYVLDKWQLAGFYRQAMEPEPRYALGPGMS